MRRLRETCWCAQLGLGWPEEGWPWQPCLPVADGGRRWWSDEAGRTGLGRRGSIAPRKPIPSASSGGGGPEGRVQREGARRWQWQPWELGCACRQGLRWPFIGKQGRGERGGGARHGRTEGDTAGTRSWQGRSVAGAAWLGHRESTAAWRAHVGQVWIRGRGWRFGRGPFGALPFGVARRPGGRRPLPFDGTEQGREREESEGRERKSEGPSSNEFFSKVCKETLKSTNMKVVGNLKLYDFHFGSKFN
jgi:hypothetical protein